MRVALHIVLGLIMAAPASAMTPVPMCAGTSVEGDYSVWDARNVEGGFVTYVGEDEAGQKAIVVLEHCKSGKALVANAVSGDTDEAADYIDNVRDAVDDYVYTQSQHTMKQIKAGLRTRGIKSRIKTIKAESCGCATYYPDQRGSRTPYK
ncbi:MAG: hypothetical protein WA790_05130 [Sulfitobacter sp.]